MIGATLCGSRQDTSAKVKQHLSTSSGVLGEGLGSLGDGVLGQLTGEGELDSSLDFTGV